MNWKVSEIEGKFEGVFLGPKWGYDNKIQRVIKHKRKQTNLEMVLVKRSIQLGKTIYHLHNGNFHSTGNVLTLKNIKTNSCRYEAYDKHINNSLKGFHK